MLHEGARAPPGEGALEGAEHTAHSHALVSAASGDDRCPQTERGREGARAAGSTRDDGEKSERCLAHGVALQTVQRTVERLLLGRRRAGSDCALDGKLQRRDGCTPQGGEERKREHGRAHRFEVTKARGGGAKRARALLDEFVEGKSKNLKVPDLECPIRPVYCETPEEPAINCAALVLPL